MKKKWHIVVVHLLIQLLIVGLGFYIAAQIGLFQGYLGSLGIIFLYVVIAAVLNNIALIMWLAQKNNFLRLAFKYSFFCSLTLWILVPVALECNKRLNARTQEIEMEDAGKQGKLEFEWKKKNAVKEAEKLDCKSYVWDEYYDKCDVQFKNGYKSAFRSGRYQIYTYGSIKVPSLKDTLAWVILTYKNALPFLNDRGIRQIDSLRALNEYTFYYSKQYNEFRIGIGPFEKGPYLSGLYSINNPGEYEVCFGRNISKLEYDMRDPKSY